MKYEYSIFVYLNSDSITSAFRLINPVSVGWDWDDYPARLLTHRNIANIC